MNNITIQHADEAFNTYHDTGAFDVTIAFEDNGTQYTATACLSGNINGTDINLLNVEHDTWCEELTEDLVTHCETYFFNNEGVLIAEYSEVAEEYECERCQRSELISAMY